MGVTLLCDVIMSKYYTPEVDLEEAPASLCGRPIQAAMTQVHPAASRDFGWRGTQASILVPLPRSE
jgi:hypothetical protein